MSGGPTIAVMQPYFFPYVGYFQLMASVDRFVFLDDVNYSPRSWMNRNKLLIGGRETYITVPLVAASQFKKINQIEVLEDGRWPAKMERSIEQSYAKAPHFDAVFPLVTDVLRSGERLLAEMAKRSVLNVARYLGIGADIVATSANYDNVDLVGQARILDICRRENASTYLNLPGGRTLYHRVDFQSRDVSLGFIDPALAEYRQFDGVFHPRLSVIDVLMFNTPADVRRSIASPPLFT